MSLFSSFKETQMLFENWRREIKEIEGEDFEGLEEPEKEESFLDEQTGEDLRPILKKIVNAWTPSTPEGIEYEKQIQALLGLGSEVPAITEKKRK